MNGTHPDFAELQSYADGERQNDQVAAHVESCAACRAEVAAVRRVTAALSLGSKPPDSLAATIRSRRAGALDETRTPSLPRARSRARAFALPMGLAAAAAVLIFVPRSWRTGSPDDAPASPGAKSVAPGVAVFETVLTRWAPSSIDSVLRALNAPRTEVELRYSAGRDDSAQALGLADRVAGFLRAEGVDSSVIKVRPDSPQAPPRPLPGGAIGITVRARP